MHKTKKHFKIWNINLKVENGNELNMEEALDKKNSG